MAQSRVTSYYNTRKKRGDAKEIIAKNQEINLLPSSASGLETCSAFFASLCDKKIINSSKEEPDFRNKSCSAHADGKIDAVPSSSSAKVQTTKVSRKSTKPKTDSKPRGKKKNDIRTVFQAQADRSAKLSSENATKSKKADALNVTYELEAPTLPANQVPILKTPKRPHSETEPPVDSKKKKLNSVAGVSSEATPGVGKTSSISHRDAHPAARKRLDMTARMNQKEPKQEANKNERSPSANLKFLSCSKLEDLKERLKKFDKTYQKLKEFHSDKFKITSIISPPASATKNAPVESEKPATTVPCYERFADLNFTGPPSLTLPFRYKVLAEMFRSSDTIVSMLHNRKERCTFEKLKSGVQDMTKKSFTKHNLGQIKTVFPTAYKYSIEKNPPSVLNRNPGLPQYQLIVSPVLNAKEENVSEVPESSKLASFIPMSPSCLVERNHAFSAHLLHRVKQYHQAFLAKLNPPIQVPMEKLTKWHAKFRLDEVPDIEASPLPEPPNAHKIDTARDVLNKLKGVANQRIENALEKVAQMNAGVSTSHSKEEVMVKPRVTSGVLKGISMDLLQRIRARENATVAEEMTVSVEEQKRAEMLERIPELVNILRTYFITERKAAMSMEDAAQRLSDSYHTSLAPAEVEKHIYLMSKLFPSWITLIPIRKGMFVKIDKNKDVNVMLSNMPKK